MVHQNNKKFGFTVMEMSIAIMVFALVLAMGYKIFSGASVGFQRSTKSLTMQNEMRNGLNFIREEMQRASYKSTISINNNAIEYDYYFKLCKDSEIDGKTSNKVIAKWNICKPFKKDKPGVVYDCTLRVSNGEIVYSKIMSDGNDDEIQYQNKVVLTQIDKIKLSTEDIRSGTGAEIIGAMINMEISSVNNTKGQSDLKVSAQTGARIEVKVEKEL